MAPGRCDWGCGSSHGVGETERERIEAESRRGEYRDLSEVVRRLPLGRDILANLAAVGAFTSLGVSRRQAIWAVEAIDGRADLLLDGPPEIPALPPLSAEEEVRLDYQLLGCAPGGRHLMAFYRPLMDEWGVVTATDLANVPHGAAVRVSGIVAIRQRPETAKGITFLTLEDECGLVNVVVMPDLSRRERQTLRLASLLAVAGEVERVDGVTHVRARRLRAIGEDAEAGALLSKHFA